MTCIVGIEKEGCIVLGGDRAASTPMSVIESGRSKVFTKGPFVIGYSGSFRVGQVIEHLMGIPPHHPEATDLEYLVGGLIEHIRFCLKSSGVVDINNAVETSRGTMLIGYNGTLYEMDSDFQCLPKRYAAIGSGYLPALGVLHHITSNDENYVPQYTVKAALEAGAYFNPFVRPPFDYVVQDKKEVGRAPAPKEKRNVLNLWGLKKHLVGR